MFWKYTDIDNSLLLSVWRDKQTCCHISTFNNNKVKIAKKSKSASRREKRFSKLSKDAQKQADFNNSSKQIPDIVNDYKKYMRGVDLFNQVSSYYSFPHRGVKWYRSIINWLMEVAINNSYKLYKKVFKDGHTLLDYRKSIIKNWQKDYIENTAKNSRLDIEEEQDVCRMGISKSKGDCDICSDRVVERKVTSYVCLNVSCMIIPNRNDLKPRHFRVHPECFHLYLA